MDIEDDEDSFRGRRQQPQNFNMEARHIANIMLYILGLVALAVTYLALKPFPARRVEFPTLVTIAPQGDLMWGVIGLSELVYVLGQATIYRDDPTAKLVSPWFCMTSIFQLCWLGCVWIDFHLGSMVCMTVVVVLQVFLCLNIDNGPVFAGFDCFKYWFFRIPFSIHGGWALVVLLEEVNMWSESLKSLEDAEKMSVTVTSLGTAFAIMTGFAIGVRRPDPVFCLIFGVGMWMMATVDRTTNDENAPVLQYSDTILDGFNYIFYGCTMIALCYTVLAAVLRCFQRACMKEQGTEITIYATQRA